MITFRHHSVEKSTPKVIENVEVNDIWTIKSIKCTKGGILKKLLIPEMETKDDEITMTYYFEASLRNKIYPNIKLDLYILNIIVLDSTKRFVRQRMRYYNMYSTEIFDSDKDISILEHLKSLLANKTLDKLFESKLQYERRRTQA